jgi:hypothetical protein
MYALITITVQARGTLWVHKKQLGCCGLEFPMPSRGTKWTRKQTFVYNGVTLLVALFNI